MRLSMRRRYASFATATALPRTAYLAKCRHVASSFSYRNRPRPRWPLLVSVRHRGLARRLVSLCRACDVAVVTARQQTRAIQKMKLPSPCHSGYNEFFKNLLVSIRPSLTIGCTEEISGATDGVYRADTGRIG